MKAKLIFVCSALFILSFAASLQAQVPQLLNYQGKLANSTTSELALTFSIYPDTVTTTPLWRETQVVKTTNGVFNVLLGKEPFPSGLFTNSGERYLGIKVDTGTELKPRVRITSVAYAIRASQADGVADGAVNTADLADNAVTSAKIATGHVVKSINTMKDDVTLSAGSNITITPSENSLTIAARGFSLPYAGNISSSNGAINVVNSGTGGAIVGFNTGTGRAGEFDIRNANNAEPALFVYNEGTQWGGFFQINNANNTYPTLTGITNGTGFAGHFEGSGASSKGVYIKVPAGQPGLQVASGTKNAVVATSQGARALYTEEASEVWFTDYGFGRLQNGRARLEIDRLFAETVNLEEPYHVFVQAYGNAELYVSQRTRTAFEINLRDGDPNVEFSYRLVAKRRGYEQTRLERAPWADNDPDLYPEKHAKWKAQHNYPKPVEKQ